MTLPVGLMSLFIRKDTVEERFSGGLAGFHERYPRAAEDDHLLSLGAMSGGDLQLLLDELREAGLDPAGQIAIAEAFGGPTEICSGIAFDNLAPDALIGGWVARGSASSPHHPAWSKDTPDHFSSTLTTAPLGGVGTGERND